MNCCTGAWHSIQTDLPCKIKAGARERIFLNTKTGSVPMATITSTSSRAHGMTKDERFVILASSLGTVFEWYDFYLYGSLAGISGSPVLSAYPPATRDIFALLAFATLGLFLSLLVILFTRSATG